MSAPDKGVAVAYLMLIAGDDSWVTELVSALEKAGHRLTVVPSVAEAIAGADEEAPALAIADAGTAGLDVAARLRGSESLASMPVVVLAEIDRSGWDRSMEGEAIFQADALLEKPVAAEVVVRRVEGILASQGDMERVSMTADMTEVIDRAIANEEVAHQFYVRAAKAAITPETRDIFEELARDELEHKRLVIEFKEGARQLPKQGPPRDGRLVQFIGAPDLTPDLSPTDALLLAARKEQLAVEFYGAWAALYPPGPEADLLTELANIERGHKEKVERLFATAAFPGLCPRFS